MSVATGSMFTEGALHVPSVYGQEVLEMCNLEGGYNHLKTVCPCIKRTNLSVYQGRWDGEGH